MQMTRTTEDQEKERLRERGRVQDSPRNATTARGSQWGEWGHKPNLTRAPQRMQVQMARNQQMQVQLTSNQRMQVQLTRTNEPTPEQPRQPERIPTGTQKLAGGTEARPHG